MSYAANRIKNQEETIKKMKQQLKDNSFRGTGTIKRGEFEGMIKNEERKLEQMKKPKSTKQTKSKSPPRPTRKAPIAPTSKQVPKRTTTSGVLAKAQKAQQQAQREQEAKLKREQAQREKAQREKAQREKAQREQQGKLRREKEEQQKRDMPRRIPQKTRHRGRTPPSKNRTRKRAPTRSSSPSKKFIAVQHSSKNTDNKFLRYKFDGTSYKLNHGNDAQYGKNYMTNEVIPHQTGTVLTPVQINTWEQQNIKNILQLPTLKNSIENHNKKLKEKQDKQRKLMEETRKKREEQRRIAIEKKK